MLELLQRLFGYCVTTPPPIGQDDETYPVHFIDQGGIIRDSIINYTFRYDTVLDPKVLQDSLVKLLNIGDWRKLGGRLRSSGNGKLKIKVPQNFTAERPAICFSHDDISTAIEEHPVASRLPRDTGDAPSIHEGCDAFRCFGMPVDLPNRIRHYLTTDEPMISLRVTTFLDASLVALTFPHSLADVMGVSKLLQAWSMVLADRLEQVPPLLGAREDVLEGVSSPLDKTAQAPYVLEHQQIKGLSLLKFVLRFVWDQLFRRNIQARTIFLPAKFVQRLRQEAEEEDETSLDSDKFGKAPAFLSDGDLITAWGSRMVLASRPRKPAIICNVFDLRRRILNTFNPSASYLQNLILPATVLLPSALPETLPSIARIARQLRQAITQQTTDTQARSLLRIARASYASIGMMPLFGNPNAMVIACTNWSKARLREAADFGPAVVSASSRQTCGTPVSYWGTTTGVNDHPRDVFVIYGKDGQENYWLHGYLRTKTWDLIEREFLHHEYP